MGSQVKFYDREGRMWPEGPVAMYPNRYTTEHLPHRGEFIVTRVVMPQGLHCPELDEFYRTGSLDLGSLKSLTFQKLGPT